MVRYHIGNPMTIIINANAKEARIRWLSENWWKKNDEAIIVYNYSYECYIINSEIRGTITDSKNLIKILAARVNS